MRRFWAVLTALVFCFALCTGVSAATQATGVQSFSTVNADGSCQVTLTVTIHVDNASDSLQFPLPEDASDITLNGTSVLTHRSGSYRVVNLTGMYGDFTVSFHYTLNNVITEDEKGNLTMTLPLLAGFAYPVNKLEFSVTMPGVLTASEDGALSEADTIRFSSGYHREGIESSITYSVRDAVINGKTTTALKDHETLTMTMSVTDQMFPQSHVIRSDSTWASICAGVFAAMAAVYFLFTMFTLPPRRIRQSTPPEGITAGEIGCLLSTVGVDLTATVLSWAELGYILIRLDDNGRVILHKRMEMGNERSTFEVRAFKNLFGKRKMVEGSGYHYAMLCKSMSKKRTHSHGIYQRSSGNPLLLRILSAVCSLFAGACMGLSVGSGAMQTFLAAVLAILGVAAAWMIHDGAVSILSRDKTPGIIGLGCCVAWILIGALTGQLQLAALTAVFQILIGFCALFGGKRTEGGLYQIGQILGLRHYMRTVHTDELQRILRTNPDYYYEMAPYALALGVDKAFADRFSRIHLPDCSYLSAGMDRHNSAKEFAPLLRLTADSLDLRQKRLFLERFMGK